MRLEWQALSVLSLIVDHRRLAVQRAQRFISKSELLNSQNDKANIRQSVDESQRSVDNRKGALSYFTQETYTLQIPSLSKLHNLFKTERTSDELKLAEQLSCSRRDSFFMKSR